MRDSGSSESTINDGSPRRDFAGEPVDADDVAEMDVDLAGLLNRAQQLDAPAPVDKVEEDELAHIAAGEHSSCEAALRLPRRAVLELFRLGADGGDLVAVRKAFRRGHRRASLVSS